MSTVEKAFSILERIGSSKSAISLFDLAQQTSMPKPTVHRILTTLIDLGYVAKHDRGYTIGINVLSLAKVALQQTQTIREAAANHLVRVRDRFNESVNLAVWQQARAVLVAAEVSRHVLRIENRVGQVFSLNNTSVGKAIAAYLPWHDVKKVIQRDGPAHTTEYSITDVDSLKRELDRIRENRVAIDNEESVHGVRCVATPILTHEGGVLGAVSISGPVARMTDAVIEEMKSVLADIGKEISVAVDH